MISNDKVSLKWRVWFGIVLIVAIFGNIDSHNLGPRIKELQDSAEQLEGQIARLEQELDEKTSTLEGLLREIKTPNPPRP